MDSSNRFIVANWNGRLLCALISGKKVIELALEDETASLGNIYIGKAKKIIKNLNSAFVDYKEGKTGYLSLTDNPLALHSDGSRRKLLPGDEIIVQVAKDAVKTKDPVLSSNLNFTGKFAILTSANPTIGFSSKISDRQWKEGLRPQLEAMTEGKCGIIVRTNAYHNERELLGEIRYLLEQYRKILKAAPYRSCYSLLYQAEPGYIEKLNSFPRGSLEEIVTDDVAAYNVIQEYLAQSWTEEKDILRLYEDKLLPLISLYALEPALKEACQKKVWLKSGGYLVIEPTEAMVVIDVNTGKYSGKKNLDDTIRMINLEAAREICRQLRLRNLSGIVIVDFIDMKEENDRAALMDELRKMAAMDTVKTTVVDMTQLGLVELTRKKGHRPLREQLALADIYYESPASRTANSNRRNCIFSKGVTNEDYNCRVRESWPDADRAIKPGGA